MMDNHERRDSARIEHTSALKIKELKSGRIHKARMLNHSKNGLYFETNSVLHPGDRISIAIQNSPFASTSDAVRYWFQNTDH